MIPYNFPTIFINWIKTLNENSNRKIILNGRLLQEIKIERGIKQWCPLAMFPHFYEDTGPHQDNINPNFTKAIDTLKGLNQTNPNLDLKNKTKKSLYTIFKRTLFRKTENTHEKPTH